MRLEAIYRPVGELISRRQYRFPTFYIDDPLLDRELNRIYYEFKHKPYFPHGYCSEVSKEVAQLGLHIYPGGNFRLDFRLAYGTPLPDHWWCQDDKGKIIDLTASQFNWGLWPQNWIPGGTLVIEQNNPLYKRYLPAYR